MSEGIVIVRPVVRLESVEICTENLRLLSKWLGWKQMAALKDGWEGFEHNWFVRGTNPDGKHDIWMVSKADYEAHYERVGN